MKITLIRLLRTLLPFCMRRQIVTGPWLRCCVRVCTASVVRFRLLVSLTVACRTCLWASGFRLDMPLPFNVSVNFVYCSHCIKHYRIKHARNLTNNMIT